MLKRIRVFAKRFAGDHAILLCLIAISVALSGLTQVKANVAEKRVAMLEQDNEAYLYTNVSLMNTIDELNDQIDTLHQQNSELVEERSGLKRSLAIAGQWVPSDIQEVVCMVIAESGNQPLEGQMAVAQCIRDRYVTGFGGNTIHEVLTAQGQFAEPYKGDTSLYPKSYEAVMRVFIFGERVFDQEVIYFYNPTIANPTAVAAFEANNAYLGTIGDHVFRSW